MFGAIARRYDLLNHLLSANLDRRWRRAAAGSLPFGPSSRILDLCCGTGDMAVALAKHEPRATIVCCDFSRPMLAIAAAKLERRGFDARCPLVEADGLRLPFGGETFDAVTIAFGLRNLADRATGLAEMRRVLAPGGVLRVLEFSRPDGAVLSRLYGFYLGRVLPRIGDGATPGAPLGGASPSRPPPSAVSPPPATVAGTIRDAGFGGVGWQTMTGGIVAIHTAYR
jgi:demethylmenaquinone methyltransferase/2-methoxy-6-polyprenyl-1,4-benzoquinol methylase